MSKRQAVTQPMIDAYVAWEPPCELDVSKPARVIGLIRSAFRAGYKSGERATPKSSEGALLEEALAALTAMLDDWGGFRDVNGEEAASALAAKAVLAKAGKAQS